MKKRIAILLALLLALTSVPALAAGQVHTTASVNLREGPGLGYAKVDAVKPGTTLEYLDETSTDERGVDWYLVAYGDLALWISSRYSYVEEAADVDDGNDAPVGYDGELDEDAVIEVSGWYLDDLIEVADALGATDFMEINSEIPNQYSNGSVVVAGDEIAEYFGIYGEGYSMFGVTVGMDIEEARQKLTEAGLTLYADSASVTFLHPADERSLVDVDGYDSNILIGPHLPADSAGGSPCETSF